MRAILEERDFPLDELRLLASARSAGRRLSFRGAEYEVEDAATADLSGLDLALFSSGAAASRTLAPRFAAAGAIVIDNSSAWRMDPEVPLVVPEVNAAALGSIGQGHRGQSQLHDHGGHAGAQAPPRRGRPPTPRGLHLPGGVRGRPGRSGRTGGQLAKTVDRAGALTFDGAAVDFPEPETFPDSSPTTCCPWPGPSVGDGSGETNEEQKFRDESRKILDIPDLAVICTCVRVPVFTGHSLSIVAEFERPMSPERGRRAPRRGAGGGARRRTDTPPCRGPGPVARGPICGPPTPPATQLALFVSGDNLRKGAALNAVQIAEALVATGLVV